MILFDTELEWIKASEFTDAIDITASWNAKKTHRLYRNIYKNYSKEIAGTIIDAMIINIKKIDGRYKKKKKSMNTNYKKRYSNRYSSRNLETRWSIELKNEDEF